MSSSSSLSPRPILVVGSVNADVFIDIDRLPLPGETLSTNRVDSGHVLPGGKGANQAVGVAQALPKPEGADGTSSFQTYFAGMLGNDGHAVMLRSTLEERGVDVSLSDTAEVPCGQAFILLQKGGQNSIIIVPGANHSWPSSLPSSLTTSLSHSGALLLQREIPDQVNLLVAHAAKQANVPVFLDLGGVDQPMPDGLLESVTFLTANETELARLMHMETSDEQQVLEAARALHQQRPHLHLLLTLGHRGSMLLLPSGEVITYPALPVSSVIDTTGAGDCFRGAFTVAYLEGRAWRDCLKFASCAAAICIQTKGAMTSMPEREKIEEKYREVEEKEKADR